MMNFGGHDWRERRNLLNQSISFGPMHYTIANYSTDSRIHMKTEMKTAFGDTDLLHRLHSIPDPLKKNLADTVVNTEEKTNKNEEMASDIEDFHYEELIKSEKKDTKSNPGRNDFYHSITGITGFISNFFGAISGAMFHKRSKSPVSQYYDCFDYDADSARERSPSLAWQSSKLDDQNKNERAHEQFSAATPNDNMNNYRVTVAHCEQKLNAVRSLLSTKTPPSPRKLRFRRPRKVFVEPGSVEENFEDAFSPEDFVSLANEEYVEFISVRNTHNQELCEADAPKLKINIAPAQKCTEIINQLPINDKIGVGNSNCSQNVSDAETHPKTDENQPESTKIAENLPAINDTMKSPESNTIKISDKAKSDMKQEVTATETMEIVKSLPESEISEPQPSEVTTNLNSGGKKEVIASCEDKMAKLKSLLQGKCKKNTNKKQTSTDSVPEPVKETTERPEKTKTIPIGKTQDKKFKNPNRVSTGKRKKCLIRRNIHEDMLFASEIDSEEVSSVENSPKTVISDERLRKHPSEESIEEKEYFDEVKGRFRSTSTTESEDSFQIVFADSPKMSRTRKPSDCDSEDSFIVFEESPDSCYTANEVFGDESDESDDESDSESDVSDSGFVPGACKLSHSMSRTVSDLTDDSLYEEKKIESDEVDCASRTVCEVIPTESAEDLSEKEDKKPGLLIDEARKRQKKDLPAKKVTFSSKPPKVHVMRVWAFAARQARAGHWERHALDRERFKRRIADVDMAVSWVLKPQHRSRVMFQRFMPWWNALKRKELAEKKKKAEEEKLRQEEEERVRKEAEEQAKVDSLTKEDMEGANDQSEVGINVDNEESNPVVIGDADKSKDSEKIDKNETDISKMKIIEIKNEVKIKNEEKTQKLIENTNIKDASKIINSNHKKNIAKDEKLETKVLNIINKRKISTC